MTRHVMAASLEAHQRVPEVLNGSASDLERIGELYREHADFVHSVILRLGGPAMDADDLTHEVFLIALRKWASLPPDTDARGWLHGVAAHTVSAARRKAIWRRRLGLANPPSEPHWLDPDVERRDARAQVYRLVEGISEKKRTVFLLFELEGLSGEEIAALVRAPLKTVWTRLHYARREFQKALELERKREP
jgi:RNA polymerase sigma-70 factor (ECF subfamily)